MAQELVLIIFLLCAVLASFAIRSAFRSVRQLLWRYDGRRSACSNPKLNPGQKCPECGQYPELIRHLSLRSALLKLGLSMGVLCGCVAVAFEVGRWYVIFQPRQVIVSGFPARPAPDIYSIAEPMYQALIDRVDAGTISAKELGAVWDISFAHAINFGHWAFASKDSDGKWNVLVNIPSQVGKPPTMVVEASLQTTSGVELVSKEIWTLHVEGFSLDDPLSDVLEDMDKDHRLECVLTELPPDQKVVLIMAVRPWNEPDAELEIVCRRVFSITIEPE